MKKDNSKLHIICEAGIMLACAQILSYLRIYKFPSGGSVDLAMLPIVIFCAQYGPMWGTLTGLVYGVLQYFIGLSTSIDWTTLIVDYLVAYTLLGFGAGLSVFLRKNRGNYAILFGGILRFLAHLFVGALVWGRYMPDVFFGMRMTSVWVYSLLYNGSYMFLDMALVTVMLSLLRKPMGKYLGEKL